MAPRSLEERFHKEFAQLLAIGMSYDEYWRGDPYLVLDYIEAENLRRKRQNEVAWLHGLYTYEALCCVSPLLHAFASKGTKAIRYPDKPYGLFGTEEERHKETEEEREEREEQEAVRARAYMYNMMRALKDVGTPK